MRILLLVLFLLVGCTGIYPLEENAYTASRSVELRDISACQNVTQNYTRTETFACRLQHTYLDVNEVCAFTKSKKEFRSCVNEFARVTQNPLLCNFSRDMDVHEFDLFLENNYFIKRQDKCLMDAGVTDCTKISEQNVCEEILALREGNCLEIDRDDIQLDCLNRIQNYDYVTTVDLGSTQGITTDGEFLYIVGGTSERKEVYRMKDDKILGSCSIPVHGNNLAYDAHLDLLYATDFDVTGVAGGRVIVFNKTSCVIEYEMDLSKFSARGVFVAPTSEGIWILHHTTNKSSDMWNTTLLLLDQQLAYSCESHPGRHFEPSQWPFCFL